MDYSALKSQLGWLILPHLNQVTVVKVFKTTSSDYGMPWHRSGLCRLPNLAKTES